MAFKYSRKQKQLARNCNSGDLRKAYEQSEKQLDILARKGSIKELNRGMKLHQNFEYALLYQQSPEFQKLVKKGKVKVEIW